MKTAFILMTQYDGLAIVPVDLVCRDYFRHLTVEEFLRKVLAGKINIPVVDNGIAIEDLARHIDSRRSIALDDAAQTQKQCEEIEAALAVVSGPVTGLTIYFIESSGHVKIGKTTGQVERRLQTLSTSHWRELRLLATIENAPGNLETVLHSRFAKHRVRGEWFQAAPELLAYIEQVKK